MQLLTLNIKCPVCGESLPLAIDLSNLESVSGIYYLPVIHKDHGFMLYVDRNMMIRGYQIFQKVIKTEKTSDLSEILKLFIVTDTKHLSFAIVSSLFDEEIYIISDVIQKILEFLELSPKLLSSPTMKKVPEYIKEPSKIIENFIDNIKKSKDIRTLIALKEFITQLKDLLANIEKTITNSKTKILYSQIKQQIKSQVEEIFVLSFIEKQGLTKSIIFSII